MSLLCGYHHQGEPLPPNVVCHLHKSLYGLKQASRQWFSKFSGILLATSFKQSVSDGSLFIKKVDSSFLALLVYVDDIVIASNNQQEVDSLKVFFIIILNLKTWEI